MRFPSSLLSLSISAVLLAQPVVLQPRPASEMTQDPELSRLFDLELELQNEAAKLNPEKEENHPRLRINLEKQIAACTDILHVNPESGFAMQNKSKAEQMLLQLDNAAQQKQSAKAKGETALQSVWGALAHHDLTAAMTALATARAMLPNDDRVLTADRAVSRLQTVQRIRGFSLIGLSALSLGGALAWLRRLRGEKQPILVVQSGLLKGRRFPIEQDTVNIGAIESDGENRNDLVIEDDTRRISRFHCYISKRNQRYFFVDRGTPNGTHLNGKRLSPWLEIPIKKGDHLDLARVCTIEFNVVKK